MMLSRPGVVLGRRVFLWKPSQRHALEYYLLLPSAVHCGPRQRGCTVTRGPSPKPYLVTLQPKLRHMEMFGPSMKLCGLAGRRGIRTHRRQRSIGCRTDAPCTLGSGSAGMVCCSICPIPDERLHSGRLKRNVVAEELGRFRLRPEVCP